MMTTINDHITALIASLVSVYY